MNDEFCAGVQILLKRIESNPEEFTKEFSPWRRLMDAVLAYKLHGDYDDRVYLRALTEEEIEALHKMFLPIARQEFDTWIMKEVLGDREEEKELLSAQAYQMAQGKRVAQGWTDPRMLQNAVPPGGMVFVGSSAREKERGSIMQRIQNTMNKLAKL